MCHPFVVYIKCFLPHAVGAEEPTHPAFKCAPFRDKKKKSTRCKNRPASTKNKKEATSCVFKQDAFNLKVHLFLALPFMKSFVEWPTS